MFKFIIILLMSMSVFSQRDISNDTAIEKIVMDSSLLQDVDKSAFQIFVIHYSDSINNSTTFNTLPKFLKDADFDYYNTSFWFPGNYNISLRNIIIAHVNNCAALKLIINNGSGVFKMKPKKGYRIDFAESSFYDLAV